VPDVLAIRSVVELTGLPLIAQVVLLMLADVDQVDLNVTLWPTRIVEGDGTMDIFDVNVAANAPSVMLLINTSISIVAIVVLRILFMTTPSSHNDLLNESASRKLW